MITKEQITSSPFPKVKLGEIVEFLDHKRRPITSSDRVAGSYPYYGANGIQDYVDGFIFDEELILLAEDGGHFDNPDRGIAYEVSGKTWVNNHAHVLRTNPETYQNYLFRVLQNYDIRPFITGTTRGKLTKASAEGILIPLPPLPEQRRIAAILDKAEAIRAKRRAALAKLDTLAQSIFLEMFGDPVTNQGRFEFVELSSACISADDIKCGPFGTQLSKSEFTEIGIPLWGIKNVNARFEIPAFEFISEKTARRLEQYSIVSGDIIMTRKGTIGNCAVYPTSFPSGVMHSDLLRIRTSAGICNPVFLSHQLHYSKDIERQIALISGGAVMPGINVTKLKSLKIILPDINIQTLFSMRISLIESLKAAHRASLAKLDALFTSLQHRAFQGEL